MGQQGCQPRYHRVAVSNQVVIGALFLASLTIGMFLIWQQYGQRVIGQSDFVLSAEGINISPPPKWIRTDLASEAMVSGNLNNLNMRQPDVTVRVAQAFAMQSWVKRVVRVSKSYPGQVQVEIEYRRPVAMVEVTDGLSPIDSEGVLLPSNDFLNEMRTGPSELAQALPRIWAHDTGPVGPLGTQWGDPRIHNAAKLATTLLPVWKQLGLYQIVALGGSDPQALESPRFILRTTNDTRVEWGTTPGKEHGDEPTPAMKIKRLQEFIKKNGSLEAVGPQGQIDVSHAKRIHVVRGNTTNKAAGIPNQFHPPN